MKDNGAYFGFIHPEEKVSGSYHDFSLTIFPSDEGKPWLVCLGVGSSGFKNDYELSTFPGLRRLFSKLIDENGFCKSDLSGIETSLPKSITGNLNLQHIRNTIKTYSKVLPVCQIIYDLESEEGLSKIVAFVAGYAKLRDWPTNNDHRRAVSNALEPFIASEDTDDEKTILRLQKERKYIVLQEPPGTCKTRVSKVISNDMNAKVFFTQFHAETSYSDFIYGILPNVKSSELSYSNNLGVFTRAVKYEIENPSKNTVLIINEINLANLSNSLYLIIACLFVAIY